MISFPAQKTASLNASTAAGPGTPVPAHWDAAPVADFHQARAGVLQPMPGRAAPASPAPPRRPAAGARGGAKALGDAAAQALDAVRHGGAAALAAWLEESGMDPLERDTLLRQALHDAPDDVAAPLQQARDRLMREHGAELAQGREQQSLLQATLHDMAQPADGTSPRTTLAQLADRLLGTRTGAPIDAHALGQALADASCAGDFCTRLAALRRQRARAPRTRLANTGPQVWLSLKDAASLLLLQSCHAIGAPLHDDLTNAGLLAPGAAPHQDGGVRAALALLALAQHTTPDAAALVGAIGASAQAQHQGAVHRQLARAVRELPLTLWPQPHARRDLLASLDATGAPAQRSGADLRGEQDLRTAHRLMTSTNEEQ